MANTNTSYLRFILGLASPALITLGTALPSVKTSLGYTYTIFGAPMYTIYALAAALVAFNLTSDKIEAGLAKRLQMVSLLFIGAVLVYGASFCIEGINWFHYQTAYDAPTIQSVKLEAFWQTLAAYDGRVYPMVGSLQIGYNTWGPGVSLNNVPIYQEAINSLSYDRVKDLLAKAGLPIVWYPLGFLCYVGALVTQALIRPLKKEDVLEASSQPQ
ncbi:hypothetical protein [Azospira sp. I09]|uniref:hypothetical protein n=1 Tax=Azospira sp. I09 TaxID=1765049 RepID=UPI001260503B|nr:hypothetical protein [Azospira sp. I09]BBN89863.1 hypothetical protein AZSP09_28860 [Azospira sp. I09]